MLTGERHGRRRSSPAADIDVLVPADVNDEVVRCLQPAPDAAATQHQPYQLHGAIQWNNGTVMVAVRLTAEQSGKAVEPFDIGPEANDDRHRRFPDL